MQVLVWILAALFPVQLPTGRAGENVQMPGPLQPMWETWNKLLDPSFGQAIVYIRSVNQQMWDSIYVPGSNFAFQINIYLQNNTERKYNHDYLYFFPQKNKQT